MNDSSKMQNKLPTSNMFFPSKRINSCECHHVMPNLIKDLIFQKREGLDAKGGTMTFRTVITTTCILLSAAKSLKRPVNDI